MAAVVSEFVSDSHFQHTHTMINGSSKQRSPTEKQYLQRARLQDVSTSPVTQPIPHTFDTPTSNSSRTPFRDGSGDIDRINEFAPSPSNSQAARSRHRFMSQENILRPSTPYSRPSQNTAQNDQPKHSSCYSCHSNHSKLPRSHASDDEDVKQNRGKPFKVRDLAHIQSFAFDGSASLRKLVGSYQIQSNFSSIYEISEMPITDVIEMVAGLLTKIVTTNDRQYASRSRPQSSDNSIITSDISTSVSTFHGKNVPNITIMSYLSRIHKYCPTTYEVFLSLLVYFDRMTERVNKLHFQVSEMDYSESKSPQTLACAPEAIDDVAKISKSTFKGGNNINYQSENSQEISNNEPAGKRRNESPTSRLFVVDSYNIHRLIIAGVTCASKFFSDVFYTNSRYAKVGGLPLPELNHLELQFLLLNDFRLFVPVEELEIYGTMLVEFYAREVISQNQGKSSAMVHSKDTNPPPS